MVAAGEGAEGTETDGPATGDFAETDVLATTDGPGTTDWAEDRGKEGEEKVVLATPDAPATTADGEGTVGAKTGVPATEATHDQATQGIKTDGPATPEGETADSGGARGTETDRSGIPDGESEVGSTDGPVTMGGGKTMGTKGLQCTESDCPAATGDGEAGIGVVGHSMKVAKGVKVFPGLETVSPATAEGESGGLGGAETGNWPRTEATDGTRTNGTGAVVPQLDPAGIEDGVLSPCAAVGVTESNTKRLRTRLGVYGSQRLPSFSEHG